MAKIYFLTKDLEIENTEVHQDDIGELFEIDNIKTFDSIEKVQKMRDYLDTEIKIN